MPDTNGLECVGYLKNRLREKYLNEYQFIQLLHARTVIETWR